MSNAHLNLPVPTIDATATYYDVASQQLHLVFTYPISISLWPPYVVVDLSTTSSATPTQVGNGKPSFTGNTGTIVMDINMSSASMITVSSLDPSTWQSGPPSDPWQLPTPPSSPFISVPSVSFTSDGSVQVTWSWTTDMTATALQVALSISGQQTPSSLISTVQRPATIATFTMTEANNLFTPGQKLIFQCTPIAAGQSASPLTITFYIPVSSGCKPFGVRTSASISCSVYCSNAMTSLCPAGTNSMQIWFGNLRGGIETVEFPNGSWIETKAQQSQQLIDASTVSAMPGFCLTSTSRGSKHQEFWWVTKTGAIDGECNDGQGWKPPGTGPGEQYPFNKPNTASTACGGSITSLSAMNRITTLWWIGPGGAIGCATWTNGSWGKIADFAPANTASWETETTQLTAQCIDESAFLFLVAPSGAVVCIEWPNFSEPTAQYNVAQPGSAARGGGLVSINISSNEDTQRIAVFWTTQQNNIEMAIIGAAKSIQQQALTEPGSVPGQTGLAACMTGENKCSVWWVGQFGDLRRMEVDLTKVTANAITNWPVFEELGPGSCRQRRSIIAQKVSEAQFEVLFVNGYGEVGGLSYGG
ncbi:hypothetical protein F53441_7710 [Fusarium austroafricanum]|uniref:Fucose-specific lectin n=1 Tax=Fusarium austroafricanum TaxID=2364996 RepID=A0A8H4KF25_9HYPO|nr:hypothetical protein F53441_7710 [Fusarium austroafricanum]